MLEHGVNFIGDTTIDIGLGEVARSSLDTIISADIPVSYIEYNYDSKEHLTHPKWHNRYDHLKQGYHYDINWLHYNAREYSQLNSEARYKLTQNKYTIAQWIWEQSEIPPSFHPAFYHVDEIWTASRFTQQAFAQVRPLPVHVMPHPVTAIPSRQLTASELGIPDNRKIFFFSFSALSITERKNPSAVIEAFRRAFPKPTQYSPILVLKAHHLDHFPQEAQQLRQHLADIPHVLIEQSLSRQEIINLMNGIDFYVSLHRSEGFGLGMAEAMLLGKPVIATNFSGNTDFMNINNSFPVRYTLTYPSPDVRVYNPKLLWADPDIDHAVELMQLVMSEPALAQDRARLGQKTIQENYSPQVIGNRIKQRLAQIQPDKQHKVWAIPSPLREYVPIDLETAVDVPQGFDLKEMSTKLQERYATWNYDRTPETRNPLLRLPLIGFVLRIIYRIMLLGKVWADLNFMLLAIVAIQKELVEKEEKRQEIQHTHDHLLQQLKADTTLLTQHIADKEQE